MWVLVGSLFIWNGVVLGIPYNDPIFNLPLVACQTHNNNNNNNNNNDNDNNNNNKAFVLKFGVDYGSSID